MLPTINGKSFLECTEEDLLVLIDNSDFRENEYIDYKQTFSFLETPKGKARDEKLAEFKSDICSFANAESGYLIYGISDINGCAADLIGIDILDDNTDRFELERRNNLISIFPKTPYIKFHFVKLKTGKYIVIIFIRRDGFAPYIHIEDEKNYKIYKRVGNKKTTIAYTELKNMFNQSISLDKELYNYRTERIQHFKEKGEDIDYQQFLMLSFIPETFLDSTYNQNVFALEKTSGIRFADAFSEFSCNTTSIPCADGLRFVPNYSMSPPAECLVHNNNIVECFLSLHSDLHMDSDEYPCGFLPWKYFWEKIQNTVHSYSTKAKYLVKNQKVFVCLTIVGCKDVSSSSKNDWFNYDYNGKIDRDVVMCAPIPFENFDTDDEITLLLKKLYLEFLLCIGKRYDSTMDNIIKELYHN